MTNKEDIANLEFNVSEIFYSIQGEGARVGLPCIFIRLQGCRLRCDWCDTPYALELGKTINLMNGSDILQKVALYNCNFIEFTGGEPLEQQNILPLISYLCDNNYEVAIETAGYKSVEDVDLRAIKIMDFKCPGSKMHTKNDFGNIQYLNKHDEIKFVIKDIIDYNFAKSLIEKYNLTKKVNTILFSPVFNQLEYRQLAEWILADGLQVRLQLQLHKFIWDPSTRGV